MYCLPLYTLYGLSPFTVISAVWIVYLYILHMDCLPLHGLYDILCMDCVPLHSLYELSPIKVTLWYPLYGLSPITLTLWYPLYGLSPFTLTLWYFLYGLSPIKLTSWYPLYGLSSFTLTLWYPLYGLSPLTVTVRAPSSWQSSRVRHFYDQRHQWTTATRAPVVSLLLVCRWLNGGRMTSELSIPIPMISIQIYLAVTNEMRQRLTQLRIIVYLHVNVYQLTEDCCYLII